MPAYAVARVPRLPEMFERWDEAAGDFVCDKEGLADWKAGRAHIEAAHQRKALEAILIQAGIAGPNMLLAKEADLRGVTISDMATLVLSKQAESQAKEINRQREKLAGKGIK